MALDRLTRRRGAIAALLTLLLPALLFAQQAAQSTGPTFNADDPLWIDEDNLDIEPPADWPVYAYYDVYENLLVGRGDPEQRRAININTLGEVPDSSWFTNRLGVRDLSVDEIVRGANVTGPPAEGQWTVISRPSGGVTPKFLIEDREGSRFLLKFDPLDNPEIASSADTIGSKLFHAFGYHVAEAYIVSLTKDRLVIEPGASFTDLVGVTREIDQIDVDFWMENAPVGEDGVYRAFASRFILGEGVGEFRFFGRRPDDPNDIFPHEHRRELRGYRVISAWLNHDDSRALNTYDAYVEKNGRRFIKHYLLDFGSLLGSASVRANEPRAGNEYFLQGDYIWKAAGTFGIWSRPYLHTDFPYYPAVGNIEADYFRPDLWRPEYSNAAFLHIDAADAFWAARIVSRFSDEIVREVVGTAQISDPEAEAYLTEVLLRRRDKVVDYFITLTNPLDEFEVAGSGASLALRWDNAAVRVGAASDEVSYGVRWSSFDNRSGGESRISDEQTSERQSAIPRGAWGTEDRFGYRYSRAHILTRHGDFPRWEQPVIVTLRDKGNGEIDVVGIERPRDWDDPLKNQVP